MSRKGDVRLGLLAVALISILAGTAAQAANNNNVTIPLSGTVAASCTVANSATGATTTFSDMTTGQTATLIGTITEICNDKDGYKVTLSTANFASGSPNFKGSGTSAVVPYSLTYNGTALTYVSGTATVTSSGTQTNSTGVSKQLKISFTGGFLTADSYADTITITMASQ
jgi:hypothetical protein